MMAKKIYALFADVREQECDHPCGWPYTGSMPCTGSQRFPLCGTYKDELRYRIEVWMRGAWHTVGRPHETLAQAQEILGLCLTEIDPGNVRIVDV